ncbi:collagen-like protein [Dyadobacter frigoris]|uniref:Collagen-like protein n=1 Tax=Dyadobacter frigoris TaxID=2576211 RepID=A0A4U6D076_9BACT|nr:collagen-like protein [Dyadobacter frigoris]TKT89491.1 hypothetical protein FDK13_24420 [Dyadobacter frigoris]
MYIEIIHDDRVEAPVLFQGPKGETGVKGDKGEPGNSGPAGSTGAKGDKGDQGNQGIQGIPGVKGDTGNTGPKGDKGDQGIQGIQGIQGSKGEIGNTGTKGDKGETGDQGTQGIQGVKGDTGNTGSKGDKGDQGIQGIQGIPGEKGEIGNIGTQGEKGDPGIQGIQGIQGAKGDTGNTGAKGDKGDQGIQGIQGISGVKGETGDTGPRGEKGDQGIQGIQGIIGTKGDIGNTGPQGAKGDQGIQGIQGVAGSQGPIGSSGAKGDKGDQGAPGIVTQDLQTLAQNVYDDKRTVGENLQTVNSQTAIVITKSGEAGVSAGVSLEASIDAGAKAADAEVSKVAAGISEGNAKASENNSLAYKVSAALSADAALIQSGVYTTEALGRAAVADGQAFKVQGTGEIAAFEFRRIDVNTSVLIATYASASALKDIFTQSATGTFTLADSNGDVFCEISPSGINWVGRSAELLDAVDFKEKTKNILTSNTDKMSFCDPLGNVFFEVSPNGINWVGRAAELALMASAQVAIDKTTQLILNSNDRLVASDMDGNVFFETTPNGINWVGRKAELDTITSIKDSLKKNNSGKFTTVELYADYVHVIVYGQSLSVMGSFAVPTTLYNARTHKGGILTNYNPDTAGAADTFYGTGFIPMPTSGDESGKAISKILTELIRDENLIAVSDQGFFPIVSAPGTGGASYALLTDQTQIYYKRLIESIKRSKEMAMAEGKTYNVPAFCYIQGENGDDANNTIEVFYNKLDTLFTSLNTTIKAITGQTNDVQFFVYQMASYPVRPGATTGPPLAQLKLAKEKSYVHFGTAMYQYEYADTVHLTSNGFRVMYAAIGVVIKRAIVDKIKMQPIGIASYMIQKNEASTVWIIICKMNVPVKPLIWDESVNVLYTTLPTHKGFVLKNGSADIITNVTLSHGDTVNIFCSQNPVGLTLSYAIGGRSSGGNLRDSQGDNVKIDCEGVIKRVDNWCPIFETII